MLYIIKYVSVQTYFTGYERPQSRGRIVLSRLEIFPYRRKISRYALCGAYLLILFKIIAQLDLILRIDMPA